MTITAAHVTADRAETVDAPSAPADLRFPAPVDEPHEPLSTAVTALVGGVALALSVVSTALLLTFATTTLDATAPSETTTVLETFGY